MLPRWFRTRHWLLLVASWGELLELEVESTGWDSSSFPVAFVLVGAVHQRQTQGSSHCPDCFHVFPIRGGIKVTLKRGWR